MTGELFALAALTMFSSNIILTKVASARLDVGTGFLVAVFVNVAFTLLLFVIELMLRQNALTLDARGILTFMLAGVCSTYLGRWFFFETIVRLGPARASLFQVCSPLFTVIIAWIFLGEALRIPTVFAMLLTMAGLVLVSLPASVWRARAPQPAAASRGVDLRLWLRSGVLVGAGSTFAYALGNVFRGAAIRQWNEAILGTLLGAIAALVLYLVVGSGRAQLANLRGADRTGLAIYALGGVLTATAQIAMVISMRYIPVAIAAVITLCSPLLVIPASVLLLKNQEGVGAITLIGALLTMGGMAFIVAA